MNLFFLVFARDENYVDQKIQELETLAVPYVIICGTKLEHSNVVYRYPKGKYDAINYGFNFVPKGTEVVVLNDVDTKIHNMEAALNCLKHKDVVLVFSRVAVRRGPQKSFYPILDLIRRRIPIAASGELMFIRHSIFDKIVPIRACKAEDTSMLFKVLELKHRAVFCQECYVETERTKSPEQEEAYKRKAVCGIYQALSHNGPPLTIRMFYTLLPFASPLLLVSGRKGYFWMKGILLGLLDYLRGDRSGSWQTAYMQ